MKRAKCLNKECPDPIVTGSTSRKIRNAATEHWLEHGHRSFSKIAGWGGCTFPPLSNLKLEAGSATEEADKIRELPDEDLFEVQPDVDEYVTEADLMDVLRDYVDRNSLKMSLDKLPKGDGGGTGKWAEGSLPSLAAQVGDIEARFERVHALENKVRDMGERLKVYEDMGEQAVKGLRELNQRIMAVSALQEKLQGYTEAMEELACQVPGCHYLATVPIPVFCVLPGVEELVDMAMIMTCEKHGEQQRMVYARSLDEARRIVPMAAEMFGEEYMIGTPSKHIEDEVIRTRERLSAKKNGKTSP